MLKDITIIDFQGKERRAQANYTEVNANKINQRWIRKFEQHL